MSLCARTHVLARTCAAVVTAVVMAVVVVVATVAAAVVAAAVVVVARRRMCQWRATHTLVVAVAVRSVCQCVRESV